MVTKEQVVEVLKTVKDPEIYHNVWDLGLVYDILVEDEGRVRIKMTMTTPFCPYGQVLLEEVKDSVKRGIGEVKSVEVEVVWEPPWSLERVAPEIRAQLGLQ